MNALTIEITEPGAVEDGPPLVDEDSLRLQVTEFEERDDAFAFATYPPCPSPWKHPLKALGWLGSLAFAWVSLIGLLAVIAAIPLINFLSLGYFLSASGRVARTGKLRYAAPWLPIVSRIGTITLGTWCCLLVIRIVTDVASDAALIAPGSTAALGWRLAHRTLVVAMSVHLLLALANGGSLMCFVRPIRNIRRLWGEFRAGGYFDRASLHCQQFLSSMRLLEMFWLGAVGFAGTFLWLLLPTMLFASLSDITKPGQILLTLLGGSLLIPVLCWAPFLQAHFAAERRWSAFLELRKVRRLFLNAPLGWMFSTILVYLLALPLYLFKIAAPPQDAMWFVTLIFVATIYPAKGAVGWAYGCARRRERRTSRWLTVPSRLLLVPLLAAYLFIVYFTPAIGAAGRRVLFEHHALLLPAPFAGGN